MDCRVSTDIRNINETTDQCLKKMSAYCQYLEPYRNRIEKRDTTVEDPRIADTLASDLADDFNTDPSTNEAFQEANNAFCHTKYASVDGASNHTFFDFLNGYCANPSNEGCAKSTSSDWDKLRNKFKEKKGLTIEEAKQFGELKTKLITLELDENNRIKKINEDAQKDKDKKDKEALQKQNEYNEKLKEQRQK